MRDNVFYVSCLGWDKSRSGDTKVRLKYWKLSRALSMVKYLISDKVYSKGKSG